MGDFLSAISRFFTSAWRTLGEYLHIAIPEATAVLLNDLLKLADPIVSDLNNNSLSGSQKRDQAYTLLSSAASRAAIDVGTSLINAAIELAVLKMKSNYRIQAVAPNGNLPNGVTVQKEST